MYLKPITHYRGGETTHFDEDEKKIEWCDNAGDCLDQQANPYFPSIWRLWRLSNGCCIKAD